MSRATDNTETTQAPPLPETYGRTIGPGHLDMVRELMEEARVLAGKVAGSAAVSIDELLEAADKHAAAYELEMHRQFQQSNGANQRTRQAGSILPMEVPIRRIRGQAAALHGALCEELPGDPLLGASESLAVATYELAEQWEELHEARRGHSD